MSAEADKFNKVLCLVYPDEQKIVLNMAFHVSLVVARQLMGLVFRRDFAIFFQMLQHLLQRINFTFSVLIAFQVFFELS